MNESEEKVEQPDEQPIGEQVEVQEGAATEVSGNDSDDVNAWPQEIDPEAREPEIAEVAGLDPDAAAFESTGIEKVDVSDLVEDSAPAEDDAVLKAILEAIIYVTDEPVTAQQIAAALERPLPLVKRLLDELVAEYVRPEHGLSIREVAGGFKMATKAEHHEAVRGFVKKLTPPLKLSLAALETLAVIAYKQPVTAPEIMEIRGVQGAGVLKTLLDRKLVVESGRKNVVGKPILYKTTKDFLVQFGLKDLNELSSLKEFEELSRMSVDDAPAEVSSNDVPAEIADKAPEEADMPAEPVSAESISSDAATAEENPPVEAIEEAALEPATTEAEEKEERNPEEPPHA